jgi:quercetin 2,3-dioxygenase
MINNNLPGEKGPYFLKAGQGERCLLGGQLATVIARNQDTGELFESSYFAWRQGLDASAAPPPELAGIHLYS